ncbi:hypothetical protein [Bradyrhizobium denitrificans]|uniref:hypothetical protein n=1 Tax=Bradyrhizobium denitrificans TaxID=2734912 RepID=UPI0015582623|nr:hypothetical protein [Bradyrhizobium sp. LMG 8443]NPU23985.1 hypothetical protein [Bradyrhizobium sp. LMG 8443]
MARASALAPKPANLVGGKTCSKNAAGVQLTRRLSDKANRLFGKPYRALVDLLDISERDAHYRLSARRKYTALELAQLLQSEEGIAFLVVLMDRARPRWWRAILKMGVLGSIEQRRQADLQLMRRVFDADRSATDEFAAAFRVQDPDIYGALLSEFNEMPELGASHRALDGARKR